MSSDLQCYIATLMRFVPTAPFPYSPQSYTYSLYSLHYLLTRILFPALLRTLHAYSYPLPILYSTLQVWGHALVDALSPVPPSSTAWRQLVLPAATKEMLHATSASTLRGENKVCVRDMGDSCK